MDFDGTADSEVRVVEFVQKLYLSIFPNPANGIVTVMDPSMSLDPLNDADIVRLYDATGREVPI